MYVIEDKKGRFYASSWGAKLSKSLQKAFGYKTKRDAKAHCNFGIGERVFEVHLTLGKQVK